MKIIMLTAALISATTLPALAQTSAENIPAEIKQGIKQRCIQKWTRGDENDFSMIAYCIDQEVAAWAKVENF